MALGWRKEYLRYGSYFLNIRNAYKGRADIRMFLEILLSLATISVFGVFALKPTILTIAGLYKEIKTKEDVVAQMDVKIGNLQTAQNILGSEGELVSLLEIAIPGSPKPEDFAHQTQGLASQDSVQISSLSIEEVTLKGPPTLSTTSKDVLPLAEGASGMSFSLGATGNYQNLLSTLTDLENLRIPVKIDASGLNLTKSEKGNFLNLTVSGRTPYLNE